MPDIAMCSNAACPDHPRCYRFTATPDKMQSYATFCVKLGQSHCSAFLRNDMELVKEFKSKKRKHTSLDVIATTGCKVSLPTIKP